MRLFALLATLCLFATTGCPAEDPCADYGDMLGSPDGLDITQDEHPAGWGSDQCLQCHALETTHRVNCTSVDDLDIAEVREEAAEGNETCVACHGLNGVEGA